MPPTVTAQVGGALEAAESPGQGAALGGALTAAAAGARAALAHEGVDEAELSLTLLDDAAMSELNRRWLERQGTTDVLAFPLWEEGGTPVGDVYIGWEAALRQAEENGCSAGEEVTRLAVHGTLHVLGWDHPEGPERTASPMWARQERIVAEARHA
jgi:probable rRNA maturation factor